MIEPKHPILIRDIREIRELLTDYVALNEKLQTLARHIIMSEKALQDVKVEHSELLTTIASLTSQIAANGDVSHGRYTRRFYRLGEHIILVTTQPNFNATIEVANVEEL